MENQSTNPARRRRRKRRPQGTGQNPSPQTQSNATDSQQNPGGKNRSSGGKRSRKNPSAATQGRSGNGQNARSSQSGGKRRGRNQNRNRSGGNSGSGKGSRQRGGSRRKPPATALEKFLFAFSFGLFGKSDSPASKAKAGRQGKAKPSARKAASKVARRNDPEPAFVPAKRHETASSARVMDDVHTKRLYVGNLSYDATEVELEALFRGVGNVVCAEVATDAKTQQSKGFAFVEMGSLDEARRAVQTLDNQEFLGRRIEVSGAREEEVSADDEADSASLSA